MSAPTRSVTTFGPLTVAYDEQVLTPRPWTLLQSEWAAELATAAGPGRLLELCAGAGHIGQVAALLSGRDLVQVELDPHAARYARDNAAGAGLADRVEVRQGPMDEVLAPAETFPLVVADPPYLPTADITRWPEDPVLAIDGGPDGLDVVRLCLQVAARHLVPDGVLLLQTAGDVQTGEVIRLADDTPSWGLVPVGTRRHDSERAVTALRKS